MAKFCASSSKTVDLNGAREPGPIMAMTMKTLVVGLGNPILGDDGVGWRIAEEVARRLPSLSQEEPRVRGAAHGPGMAVDVACVSLGGLNLMECLIDYERAILIDSIGTGQHPIGAVYHFRLDDLYDPTSGHTTAAHDVSLMTAIQIGRSMGAVLPDRIEVVAIESPYIYDFSEELTPPVAAAVPQAVELVVDLLKQNAEELNEALLDLAPIRSVR
jgi:hydrogenase maturation protease